MTQRMARFNMKIELYAVPEDIKGQAIKLFLQRNNLKFHEVVTDDISLLEQVTKRKLSNKISIIKITYSHGISVQEGFNEHFLNHQILEHIKKYNAKLI